MENLYLIKDLGALAGRDYRAKEIQNLQKNRAICAWLDNRV